VRTVAVVLIVMVVAAIGFGLFSNANRSYAQGTDASVLVQLNEILDNQQTIIQKLDSMTQELQVIRVRASK